MHSVTVSTKFLKTAFQFNNSLAWGTVLPIILIFVFLLPPLSIWSEWFQFLLFVSLFGCLKVTNTFLWLFHIMTSFAGIRSTCCAISFPKPDAIPRWKQLKLFNQICALRCTELMPFHPKTYRLWICTFGCDLSCLQQISAMILNRYGMPCSPFFLILHLLAKLESDTAPIVTQHVCFIFQALLTPILWSTMEAPFFCLLKLNLVKPLLARLLILWWGSQEDHLWSYSHNFLIIALKHSPWDSLIRAINSGFESVSCHLDLAVVKIQWHSCFVIFGFKNSLSLFPPCRYYWCKRSVVIYRASCGTAAQTILCDLPWKHSNVCHSSKGDEDVQLYFLFLPIFSVIQEVRCVPKGILFMDSLGSS